MLSKKQKTIVALIAILLAGALVGANMLMKRITTNTPTPTPVSQQVAPASPETDPDAFTDRDAQDVCERLAPDALKAYVTDTPDRERLLQRYFTPNARGLSISVHDIAQQPATRFSGFLNTSDGDTAVCSVATGIDAPWILEFRWDDSDDWLCDGVSGGMNGAYRQRTGQAPKAQER